MKYVLTASLLMLATACTVTPSTSGSPALNSVRAGSIVRLNQPLAIPANKVKIRVQYGEATSNVDPYEPFCEFQINTLVKMPTTLPAGDYKITRVRQYEDPFFSRKPGKNNMLASSDEATAWKTLASSADSIWHYTTAFRLQSDIYPDILQLECGSVYASGYEARHITIREFETLAGKIMNLQAVVVR